MKIQSSTIALASQTTQEQSLRQSTLIRESQGGATLETNDTVEITASARSAAGLLQKDGATLMQASSTAQEAGISAQASAGASLDQTQTGTAGDGNPAAVLAGLKKTGGTQAAGTVQLTPQQELKLQMVQQMMQSLRGRKLRFRSLSDTSGQNALWKLLLGRYDAGTDAASSSGSQTVPMRVRTTVASAVYQEKETASFAASGTVQTADGKTISVDIGLTMSREFMSANITADQTAVPMADPLVLNFKGGAAELTEQKYRFDLDSDGTGEEISFVGPGSGFLALDRNGNGTVDDGSELFGTRSGDGFADLGAYDDDGNGWIDENDEIYDHLRIWTKDENGNDQLLALGVKGVGAIYLGNVNTGFTLKGADNSTAGAIRSTGFYLSEDGSSGTIQHVDLAI